MKTFILLCIAALSAIQCVSCTEEAVVEVQEGLVAGKKEIAYVCNTPYWSFQGIPYAEAPVGNLRFKAPVPKNPWEGTWDATKVGNVCPEYNAFTKTFTSGSEDCLYLNVYSPNLSPPTGESLPVIIFLGGYAFNFDTGDLHIYGPDFFMSKNVIVVTLNSRMDALAFLALGTEEVPGNAGMKDQVLAMKWVKNNIHNFGGDPDNVTLLGHSSGAAATILHMTSPMSKNLFHRAIALSGSPTCDPVYPDKVKERSFKLGKLLGLDTKNATELLEFLQSVPYEKLIGTTCALTTSEAITNNVLFKKMAPFVPIIEEDYGQERFLTQSPLEAIESGEVNKVDAMFSYSNEETVLVINDYVDQTIDLYNNYHDLFVPYKITTQADPKKVNQLAEKIIDQYFGTKAVSVENVREFITYTSLANMKVDMHRIARKWREVGNTYLLRFSSYAGRNYYGKEGAAYGIEGAAHGDIVFYMFNPTSLPELTLEENTVEYDIAVALTQAIGNFSAYGNPSTQGLLGIEWPLFDESLAYVEIGNSPVVKVDYAPDEEDIVFWKEIHESAGIDF